jgi:hypothetical protein
MQVITLKSAPELTRVIRCAAADYRKHKAFVHIRDSVELSGTYWDGGSRSTYTAVNLATGKASTAEQYAPPQFGGPRAPLNVAIPPGVAIVETGYFCGKPATASVYINPVDATPMLPAA